MTVDFSELRSELKRVSATPGQGTGGGFLENFLKMPESDGLVVVRLLPAKSGKIKDIFQSTRIHSINNRKVHCPKEVVGEYWQGTCSICDYYNWLWRESKTKGHEEAAQMQAEARSIKPVERYYYNCIVRSQTGTYKNNQPNKTGVPLILSVGKQVHARILRAILGSVEEMEAQLGDVTDVSEGRDFKIVKKNKKGGDGQQYPYYENSQFLEPSALGTPEQVEAWIEVMHNLTTLRECKSNEELKKEIRIHRKMEKDPNGAFDLSDLGLGEPAVNHSHQQVHTYEPITANKISHPPQMSEEDQALLEDDFLKRLDD